MDLGLGPGNVEALFILESETMVSVCPVNWLLFVLLVQNVQERSETRRQCFHQSIIPVLYSPDVPLQLLKTDTAIVFRDTDITC